MRSVGFVLLSALVWACSDGTTSLGPDAGRDPDAGPQFIQVAIPSLPEPTPNFFGVWGTADNDVFLVGEHGTVVHWDGTAWTVMPTPTTVDLRGVWGRATMPDMPADDVYAVGNGGTVLHYSLGNWTVESSTTSEDLHAVAGRRNNPRVWAVGVNGVVATKDLMTPNARWVVERSATRETLNGLWVRGTDAVAVGNLGTIVRYDGMNWSRQRIDGLTVPLQGVWGTSPGELWISGLDGTLLRSAPSATDPNAMAEVMGAPKIYLRKVIGLDFGEVYFTGWGGTIGHATGSGASSWSQFSDHRLEGIWATTYQVPIPPVPPDTDAGVQTLPRYYVVGVTGSVLIGP